MSSSLAARARRFARPVLSIAAIALLVWLLDRTGWDVVGTSFAKVGVVGAVILIALGIGENLFDAASLRALLPVRVGVARLLSYTSAGALVNLIIPWEAGEVLKAGLLRRHMSDAQMLQGLVLWNYILKLSRPVATSAAMAAGLVFGHTVAPGPTKILLIATLLSFIPLFVMRLLLQLGMAGGAARLLIALRILRRDAPAWLDKARALDRDVRGVARERPRDYALGIVCQITARGFSWAACGATMKLCGMQVSFGMIGVVFAGILIASFLVMASPAKIGVFEMAGGGVFELCGLDPKMGVIVIVIMRLKMIVTTGLAALFVVAPPPPPRP